MPYISLSQAFAQWQELAADIPSDDVPMLAESWNNYTDTLAKDGQLTALQYHYAPSHDEPMPGNGSAYDALADDRAFILDAMGVTIRCKPIDSRPDRGNETSEWDAAASHWRITIRRGRRSFSIYFSQGSAHTGEPDLQDVFHAVLLDADSADNDFESWADNFGFDPDSRRAYAAWKACKRTAAKLDRLFSGSELEDLRQLFEGY